MTEYLARLKAARAQIPLPQQPSKPSKAPSEGFEGDQGDRFPGGRVESGPIASRDSGVPSPFADAFARLRAQRLPSVSPAEQERLRRRFDLRRPERVPE